MSDSLSLLKCYLLNVKPVELAAGIPTEQLHFKALVNSLIAARTGLVWVIHQLQMSSDPDFALTFNINQFAKDMTTSTILLEGLLDGLMILEQSTPSQSINFRNHKFPDGEMQLIQLRMLGLQSSSTTSAYYANFWTVANFWKHYFPFQSLPTQKNTWRVCDIIVKFPDTTESGPIIFDLIVPNFTCARELLLGTYY